jgi:hypothetical protein
LALATIHPNNRQPRWNNHAAPADSHALGSKKNPRKKIASREPIVYATTIFHSPRNTSHIPPTIPAKFNKNKGKNNSDNIKRSWLR